MASTPSTMPEPDIEATRVALKARKAQMDVSWAVLGNLVGVPGGTLSPWADGKYQGDNARIANCVARFFASEDERADIELTGEFTAPTFIKTRASQEVLNTLAWAARGKMTSVSCVPGFGKTSTLLQYQASRANAWLATVRPSNGNVANMLIELLRAMGDGDAKGTPQALSRRVVARVTGTRGLIMVDEAQHLTEQSMEELRSIHDETGIGIALVGDETLQARVEGGGRKRATPQLSSRVSMPLIRRNAFAADGEELGRACGATDPQMLAFCRELALRPGGLRLIIRTFELATILATGEREPLALRHLRDAWARLAPRPHA